MVCRPELNNQYLIGFRTVPSRRAGAQSVSVSTEVPGVEILSAETVWVPAAAQWSVTNRIRESGRLNIVGRRVSECER